MIIKFDGKTPTKKFYNIGVAGNNEVDRIDFQIYRYTAGSTTDLADFIPQLKICTPAMDYADVKYNLSMTAGDKLITCTYYLSSEITVLECVDMQLVMTADDGRIWQAGTVEVTFDQRINISEIIEKNYPDVLKDINERIESLEASDNQCIKEYAGLSNFPSVGVANYLYLDTTTDKTYYWNGTGYILISGISEDDYLVLIANAKE